MYVIPTALYFSITTVLAIGYVFRFNVFLRICSFILWLGFILSFKMDGDDLYLYKYFDFDSLNIDSMFFILKMIITPLLMLYLFYFFCMRGK